MLPDSETDDSDALGPPDETTPEFRVEGFRVHDTLCHDDKTADKAGFRTLSPKQPSQCMQRRYPGALIGQENENDGGKETRDPNQNPRP